MNRKELVNAVATHTAMEAREVDKALHGFVEVIEAVAARGESVTVSGFAKFARVDRPARTARNPATGAPVKVKASKNPKIIPLKGFKEAVRTVSAAPKLARGVWPPATTTGPAAKAAKTATSMGKPTKAASPGGATTPSKKATPKGTASKATARKATATKSTTTGKAVAKKK